MILAQNGRHVIFIIVTYFFIALWPTYLIAQQTESDLLVLLKHSSSDTAKINIYIDLHNAVFKTDIAKAEVYANQIVTFAKQSQNYSREMTGYRAIARCKRKTRNYVEVLYYDSLAQLTAKKINTPPALYSAYMDLATDYMDAEQGEKALPYLNACISIATKENNIAFRAKAENRMGWYYATKFQYSKSLSHFENAINFYTKPDEKQLLSDTKRGYAESLIALGKTEKVPELLSDAVEYYRQTNKIYSLASCLALVGKGHFNNGNFNRGLENFIEAKQLFAVNNNKPEVGMAATDIAGAYLTKNEFIKAKEFATEAETLLQSVNYDYGLVSLNTFWGKYHTALNDFNTAETYFNTAAALAKKNNFKDVETANQRYCAILKYKQKNIKSGDSLTLNYAERIVKEREQAVIVQDITQFIKDNKIKDTNTIKLLSLLYTEGGVQKIKQKLNSRPLSDLIPFDSVLLSSYSLSPYSEDTSKTNLYNQQLLELETKYHVNQKNDSLKIQIQANQIAQNKLQQRKLIIFSVAGVALLLAVGAWLQFRYRMRAEADKNKIELLQNEIHHRVKNNLAVLRRLVQVAGNSAAQDIPVQSLQNRVAAFELLHKHLYQNQAAVGKISQQLYLQELCNLIENTFDTTAKVLIKVNAPIDLNIELTEKIGLIINELVTNSFKYAFINAPNGSIDISLRQIKPNQYQLTFTDNGTGFDSSKKHDSYGLKLIAGLSNGIDGMYKFINNKGTRFELVFNA